MNLKAFRVLSRIIEKEEPESISISDYRYERRFMDYGNNDVTQHISLKKGNVSSSIRFYPERIIVEPLNEKQMKKGVSPEITTKRAYFKMERTTTEDQVFEVE